MKLAQENIYYDEKQTNPDTHLSRKQKSLFGRYPIIPNVSNFKFLREFQTDETQAAVQHKYCDGIDQRVDWIGYWNFLIRQNEIPLKQESNDGR